MIFKKQYTYIGYNIGYNVGYKIGYNIGYYIGYNIGYKIGHNVGYYIGYNIGYMVLNLCKRNRPRAQQLFVIIECMSFNRVYIHV